MTNFVLPLVEQLLAQATAAPPKAAAPPQSLWELAVKGGPVMIVIGFVSIMALSIIIERLMLLRARRVVPPGFMAGLNQGAGDPGQALAYAESSNTPVGRVLAAGIRRTGEPTEVVEKAVEEAGQREVARLRQRVRVLSALPQSATMLGLLGTILGMIKTFTSVAASAEALGKAEMLAKGIYEAWTCTAAGLLVAIPALVMYHYVLGRIDARAADLDKAASEWLQSREAALGIPVVRAQPRPPAPIGAPATPAGQPQPVVTVVTSPGATALAT